MYGSSRSFVVLISSCGLNYQVGPLQLACNHGRHLIVKRPIFLYRLYIYFYTKQKECLEVSLFEKTCMKD